MRRRKGKRVSEFFFTEDAEWPLAELAVRYEVLTNKTIKMIYDDRKGKVRWITESEQGFATAKGNLTKREWRQQAETIIKENGLEELLEQIKDHCRRYCAWLKNESELELYAMECLASRAYESWTEFGGE